MSKSRFDSRDKRRFIEATAAAMMCASLVNGSGMKPRDIVNRAGELWDEIEHQYPTKDDEDGR